MGVCTSKKNREFGRLGSNRSANWKDLDFAESNDFKIDLLNQQIKHIKPPPNIVSPYPDSSYTDNQINKFLDKTQQSQQPQQPQQQKSNQSNKQQNGSIIDHFTSLANGTIKCEILICGYIRELLYLTTKQKLIPYIILNAVKQTYFPQYIALEIGASNKSFHSTFKISHLLSSSNSIHYNGGNNECYISTVYDEVYCTDQEPRDFQLIKFFKQKKKEEKTLNKLNSYIDIISHGISNKHLFICTVDPNTSQQHIYCNGKNQFGQCGIGNNMGSIQWTEITPFWMKHKKDIICLNEKIKDIKCGMYHTIFLTENGNVWSCGQNWNGQLGLTQDIKKINEPQLVKFTMNDNLFVTPMCSANDVNAGYPAQQQLSADNIFSDGNIRISDDAINDFVNFEESVRIKSISCGDSHNLCVDENGELWVFGHIAINNNMKERVFEAIKHPYFHKENEDSKKTDIRITRINCGADHSVCCDSNGLCYLFGTNDKGQIGTKYLEIQYEPYIFQKATDKANKNKFIFENTKIVDVEAGECHTVLLTSTNDIITFGSNHYQQCSVIIKDEIVCFGHILMRHQELGITSDTFIERIIASANSTIVIINMNKRLKIIR